MQLPTLDRRSVLPTVGPSVRVSETAPASGTAALADGLEGVADVAAEEVLRRDQEGISEATLRLAQFRNTADAEFDRRRDAAPLGADKFLPDYMGFFDSESAKLVQGAPTRRTRAFLEGALVRERGRLESAGRDFVAVSRVDKVTTEQAAVTDQAALQLRRRPEDFSLRMEEQAKYLETTGLPAATREALAGKGRATLAASAALGLGQQNPLALLTALNAAPGASGVAAVEALTAEQRERLRGMAEGLVEDRESERILAVYRTDARDGARLLTALEKSDLEPALLDGIRRKVQSGVSLLREERTAANVDRLAAVQRDISTGADLERTAGSLEALYRDGVLSPTQFASQMDRAYATAERVSVESAAAREISAAISEGLPLDPENAKHRSFLDVAFRDDVGTAAPGSALWQATALAYAGKVRMLPSSAGSWLRSAARSPDVRVALAAADFYGGLEQTSPEAAGIVDADARAFLGSFSAMRSAGADPERAFETARANVYETRRDVLAQRQERYKVEAKGNAAALSEYIDRDFDTPFTAQPAASVTLGADFHRQTAQYFAKTGDVALSRDLAWQDLSRVYGPSKVNGDAVVMPFPPERFGLSPEEVRTELATVVGPELAAGVLVIPDGLTLRLVSDALSGKPVMPSYRLVTPEGDLVTDAGGVPLRYTLPPYDVLTERVQAAGRKATAEASANVERVRRRRDLLDRANANPQGAPQPPRF